MKKIFALIFCLCLFGLAACHSGGGSGDSASSVSNDFQSDIVGTWSMVSTEGEGCANCIVAVFNADGTGSVTDNNGGWLGQPGTTITGTWSYDSGYFTVQSDDGTFVETDAASISGNTLTWGVNIYQRQ